MIIKEIIRELLILFHFDLTKNLKYDRLTRRVFKRIIQPDSNCIDIGCHKGEILQSITRLAPEGKHFGFEPIPEMFHKLELKFAGKCTILPYALSDKNGKSEFQFVKNAPAYSGFRKRKYDIDNPDIEVIEVEIKKLDDVIPQNIPIDLIKIDVEGAELSVIKGARQTLKNTMPVVIFECGLGASDYYGTKPEDIYDLLTIEIGLNIYTLDSFLSKSKHISANSFVSYYQTNSEYYFIAAPESVLQK